MRPIGKLANNAALRARLGVTYPRLRQRRTFRTLGSFQNLRSQRVDEIRCK